MSVIRDRTATLSRIRSGLRFSTPSSPTSPEKLWSLFYSSHDSTKSEQVSPVENPVIPKLKHDATRPTADDDADIRASGSEPTACQLAASPLTIGQIQATQASVVKEEDPIISRAEPLGSTPPLPLLPFAKVSARQQLGCHSAQHGQLEIDEPLAAAVYRTSGALDTAPSNIWLAALNVLIQRLVDVDDFGVGVALDAGPGAKFKPVRLRVNPGQALARVLQDTVSACNVARDGLFSGDYQVTFQYGKLPSSKTFIENFVDDSVAMDLRFVVEKHHDSTFRLSLSASDALYDKEAINLLLASCRIIVDQICSNIGGKVDHVSIYDPVLVEKGVILGTGPPIAQNDTHGIVQDTISTRISRWENATPDSPAARDMTGRGLSYRQLSAQADKISLALGTAIKGCRVGVLCEPTVETIVVMLAIFRSGATYVPLDVYGSDSRLCDILDESGASTLVHHEHTAIRASKLCHGRAVHLLDLASATRGVGADEPPAPATEDASSADGTACILYTSGSTGKPKGIPLTHANLCTVLASSSRRLGLGPADVVLQQSAQGFDIAVWEAAAALTNGGTVVVADNHADPAELARLMLREGVTVTVLVVSEALALLRHGGEDTLRRCRRWRVAACGGESFPPHLARGFAALGLPDLRVFNVYGPTETSVFSSMGAVHIQSQDEGATGGGGGGEYRVPVGPPLPSYGVYIVDDEERPVPVGWVGQVGICGPGVGAGYLNRAALTKSKWRKTDFLASRPGLEGWDRMYLTGDRGRMLADGSVVILGRIDGDDQIKLRGFRVELDEVAGSIVETSGGNISDAKVTVRGDVAERKFLVAFVVFSRSGQVADKPRYLTSLMETLPLPQYMRPTIAIPLDSMPFTARGKLDATALANIPLPDMTSSLPDAISAQASDDERLTENEKSLKRMWKAVISGAGGVSLPITRRSDFFSVGGNSLLLLHLRAQIKHEFRMEIALPTLFQNSTLQGLGAVINGSSIPTAADSQYLIDWQSETDPGDLLNIAPLQKLTNSNPCPSEKGLVIILTGATGFLGKALLRTMIASPDIQHIHCLAVRNPSRLAEASRSPKVTVHPGDLGRPILGLASEATAAEVFGGADAIVHNGAEVSHLKSYASLRAPNVGSTRELARLALTHGRRRQQQGPAAIHYVSTVGVAALIPDATVLAEDRVPNSATTTTMVTTTAGYESSKLVSERLLERLVGGLSAREDAEQSPLRVLVHRPACITGTGVGSQDIVDNLMRFSARIRAVPALEPDFGAFDFIHVETAASSILLDIMDLHRGRLPGSGLGKSDIGYRHLSGDIIVPAEKLREHLGHSGETPICVLGMGEWLAMARAAGLDELVAGYLAGLGEDFRMPLIQQQFRPR